MVTAALQSDIHLHYSCTGHGPDVLLIHGWASSGRMWERLTGALAGQVRFWSVDLYGFGHSPRPQDNSPVDLAFHRDTLLAFCQKHDIRPKLIIGHSMGGMLALKLALDCPELAERLVLIAPVVTGRFGHWIDLNRLIASSWATLALAKSRPFWLLTQNVFMPLFAAPSHWYLDGQATARMVEDFKRTSWQAAAYAIQGIARENLQPHLAEIMHPTLVIVGEWDMTVPPDEGRLAARQLPNAQLLELPHTHHQPLDECPERVIAAVEQFLDN